MVVIMLAATFSPRASHQHALYFQLLIMNTNAPKSDDLPHFRNNARKQLDEVHRKRRDLPCVRVTENYRFDGPGGPVALADLLRGRSQLISIFYRRADGSSHHTYSTHARGVENLGGALQFLDLTPKGRNESRTMPWVRIMTATKQAAIGTGPDAITRHRPVAAGGSFSGRPFPPIQHKITTNQHPQ
jgi:hypothetical protein